MIVKNMKDKENMLKIIRIEKCKGGWEQMEGDYEKGDWDLWKV